MVTWADHAKNQLRHIYEYIAKDSPFYAKRVSEAIVQRTIEIDKLPKKYKVVSELDEDTVRELELYSYRIIYEVKSEELIVVLALIHKCQNIELDDIPR